MRKEFLVAMLAAGAALLTPYAADAAAITPTQYDMPNGDGQASGGAYNYWDTGYSGSGATTTDGAPLSGGLGKLTDGVVATQPWYLVSNNAGTGDYVGWYFPHTADPVLTFQFAGSPAIDSITIHMDNSNIGGVFAPPLEILVDGIARGFTPPPDGSIGSVTLAGLGLTGNSHTIQFRQDAAWTFISEISFDGGPTDVPEPTTFALLGLALASLAATRRRT